MPDTHELPKLTTIRGAAAALQLTTRSVHNLLKRGQLQSVKIGGARRIPVAELLKLAGSKVELPAIEINRTDIDAIAAEGRGDTAEVASRLERLADDENAPADEVTRVAKAALSLLRDHVAQLIEKLDAGQRPTLRDRQLTDLLAAAASLKSRQVTVKG